MVARALVTRVIAASVFRRLHSVDLRLQCLELRLSAPTFRCSVAFTPTNKTFALKAAGLLLLALPVYTGAASVPLETALRRGRCTALAALCPFTGLTWVRNAVITLRALIALRNLRRAVQRTWVMQLHPLPSLGLEAGHITIQSLLLGDINAAEQGLSKSKSVAGDTVPVYTPTELVTCPLLPVRRSERLAKLVLEE